MSALTRVTVLSASAVVGSVLGFGLYQGLEAPGASTATSVSVATPEPRVTTYADCRAPARLVEGECVTTIRRTTTASPPAPVTVTAPPAAGTVAATTRSAPVEHESGDHESDEHEGGDD